MASTLKMGSRVSIPFEINATDLAAGTASEIVCPIDGYIEGLDSIVQVAIVTGGVLQVAVAGVDVVGAAVTIPNSAAKGSIVSAETVKGIATRPVSKGQRITVTPSAAFNGGGAMNGMVNIITADV